MYFPQDKNPTQLWRSAVSLSMLQRQQSKRKARKYVNERDLRTFVRERNIFVRYCKKYAEDQRKSDGRCQCGRAQTWHERRDISTDTDSGEKWKPNDDYTSPEVTDAYGVIEFRGFGQEAIRRVPYVRVDSETPASDLRDLLIDQWHIPPPRLIISVTGGAKSFYLKTRLKNTFKRGLINAATSTGAWIITGGTSTGVMEFVGDAVKEYQLQSGSSEQQVVALGIATWGIVDNNRSLVSSSGVGSFPAYYNIEHLATGKSAGAPLDHNHTHFILVDNGTVNHFGVEIKLRARLEHYISDKVQTGVSEKQSVHVPVVLLVLEGGENTMTTAAEAIVRGTPVVVIQGSGRCADLISFAHSISKNKDSPDESSYPASFDDDVTAKASTSFDWAKFITDENAMKDKAAKCMKDIKKILDNRRLLTVFQLDSTSDATNEIDQAILYALLKASKSDVQTQLNLALAWNRSDMARKEIFNVDNRAAWQTLDLDTAMFEALVQDRVDFVQLFIDSGVDIKNFLTIKKLRDLYDKVLNNDSNDANTELVNNLIFEIEHKWYLPDICMGKHSSGPKSNQLKIIGSVFSFLVSDQQENMYSGNRFVVQKDNANSTITSVTSVSSNEDAASQLSLIDLKKKREAVPDFEDCPERELFLWAVLFNRRDLAKLFWRMSKDHIGGALMACTLLKSLAEEADREEEIDLSQDLSAHAQEWEEIAVGVLNECYQKDKIMAHSLLTRGISTWGGSTLLSMADTATCMDFMGHSCCQTKLNRIWKGRMALYTSTWKILLNLALFLIFLPLIKFSPGEKREAGWIEEDDGQLQTNKNNNNQVTPTKKHRDSRFENDETFTASAKRIKPQHRTRKLFSVRVLPCLSKKNTISLWMAIYYFHTAPVVKFFYHTLSYVAFLGFFSFFLMTDLKPVSDDDKPSVYEYIVWGWAGTMLLEEFRQMITTKPRSLFYKFDSYFSSLWNVFDLVVLAFMILSIILRYTLDGDDFDWARRSYSLTIILYYLRFLHVFYVNKNIGPKVIMIRRMLTDLAFFLVILIVIILAYGVASQALRFPNADVEWDLLKDVVYLPYWQMYGELFLDEVEGGGTTGAEESWLAIILFAVYMIFANVLLLNLLIAMFSYTFEKVQENSEKVWRFFRYDLIFEYLDRPALAPPLIIVALIFRMCSYVYNCATKHKDESDFEQILDANEDNRLTAFEKAGMEEYLHRQLMISKDHIDVKVSSTGERIEKVIEELDRVKEHITHDSSISENADLPIPTVSGRGDISVLQNRVIQLEKHVSQQTSLLNKQANQLNKVLALLENK